MSTEKSGPFGGLSASEAGHLSWEKRREKQAAKGINGSSEPRPS
jgi:hypothetical protein